MFPYRATPELRVDVGYETRCELPTAWESAKNRSRGAAKRVKITADGNVLILSCRHRASVRSRDSPNKIVGHTALSL